MSAEPIIAYDSLNTAFGPITVFAEPDAVIAVEWGRVPGAQASPLTRATLTQLGEYLTGGRHRFDLPLAPQGTGFQCRVWLALQDIPYGETETYGGLAQRLASSARAVGGALARNPIPILLPCHRVMGAGGKLTGYTGGDGIETKRQLLRLEGVPI